MAGESYTLLLESVYVYIILCDSAFSTNSTMHTHPLPAWPLLLLSYLQLKNC